MLRIVTADYEVETNTVGNWRRNRANLEQFASNACGSMSNRKAMNLAEYDKIDSALFFIIDVIFDVRFSRSRDYRFYKNFRLSDIAFPHIEWDNRGSTI